MLKFYEKKSATNFMGKYERERLTNCYRCFAFNQHRTQI